MMRSESTSALGQPSETKLIRRAGSGDDLRSSEAMGADIGGSRRRGEGAEAGCIPPVFGEGRVGPFLPCSLRSRTPPDPLPARGERERARVLRGGVTPIQAIHDAITGRPCDKAGRGTSHPSPTPLQNLPEPAPAQSRRGAQENLSASKEFAR